MNAASEFVLRPCLAIATPYSNIEMTKSGYIPHSAISLIEADAEQLFWAKATRLVSFEGLRWKTEFAGRPQDRLAEPSLTRAAHYAAWFLESLGDAAGHFVYLATQVLTDRRPARLREWDYLRGLYKCFIKTRCDKSVIKEWFTAAITETGPPERPNAGLNEIIGMIAEVIAKEGDELARAIAEEKLCVALAVTASRHVKVDLTNLLQPTWPEENWRKRKSFSAREAGIILSCGPRTVRRLVSSGKLTSTAIGRIVRDEKFEREFRRRHAPISSPVQSRKRKRRPR